METVAHNDSDTLRAVFNSVACGILVLRAVRNAEGLIEDFEYVEANAMASRILGKSQTELTGRRLLDIFPSYRNSERFRIMVDVVETGQTNTGTIPTPPPLREGWISSTLTRHNDGLVVTLSDITDLKSVETRARTKEAILANILSNLPIVLYKLDADGLFTDVEGAGLQRSGTPRERLIGKSMFDVYPAIGDSIRRALSGETISFLAEAAPRGEKQYYINYCFPAESGGLTGIAVDVTDQKTAEQKLEESRYFIEQIADSSPNLLYVFDIVENRAVYVNREITEMLGYQPEEVAAMGSNALPLLLHPDDLPKAMEHLKRIATSAADGLFEMEYRVKHANGEWRWILTRETVFKRDEQGVPVLLMGTSQDITERKRAEEEARINRHFLERIADVTPGLITVFNCRTGDYLYVSSATESMLGYPREPFLEHGMQYFARFVHPDDVARVMEENRLAIERANTEPDYNDNLIVTFEYRVRHADGRWRWLQTCGTIFERGDDGMVERIINVSIDITERREAEERLRQATEELQWFNVQLEETVRQRTRELTTTEERFQIASAVTRDAIWDWDLTTNAITYTDNYGILFGFDPGANTSTADEWYSMLHPDDAERTMAGVRQAIAGGSQLWEAEYRYRRKDGSYAYVHDRGYIVHNEDGRAVRMVGAMSDITGRKRSEERLIRSEADLREAQRISHLGSWDFDLATGEITWSEETFRIHGLDPGGSAPDLDTLLTFFAEPEELRRRIEDAVHRGISYQFDTLLTPPGGTPRYVQIIGRPQMDDTGRCVRMYGTVMDITERKEAEKRLQQSKMQLQLITDALPALISYIDCDTRYRFVNREYINWFGESAMNLVGRTMEDNVGPDVYRDVRQYVEKALAGDTVTYEAGLPFRNGHRYVRSKYIPDIDEDGRVRGFIALVMDISEEVQAQEKMRIQARVLESMSEGVSLADSDGVILYTNPAEDAIFGYEPGELIGRHVSVQNAYPEEENREIVAEVIKQLQTRGFWSGEFKNIKKDGTQFITHARITALEMSGKTYWVCVQEDITDEKRAQQALEYQHKITSTITNNATAALFMMDTRGRCTFMNPAAEAMTGYSFDEITGKMLHEIIHGTYPDDTPYPVEECPISQVLPRNKELRGHEDIFVRKDGTQYPVMCAASPIVEDGVPLATVLEVRDITEEKKARAAIREKGERLRAALTASETGTFRWNIITDEIDLDDNLDRLFGRPGSASRQMLANFIEMVHPDDRDSVARSFEASAGTGTDFDMEFRVVWSDGSVHWLYDRGKVIFDDRNRPSYMTGACVDITAHKLDQEIIRESAERFRFLADNIPQMVWQAQPDGAIDFFNHHWYAYTGLTPETSEGWSWTGVIHPDDLEENIRIWRHSVETGEPFEVEHRLLRRDGVYRWHLGRSQAMRDDQGNIVLWIGTNADIDDQKQFAEELELRVQERTEQLMRSNEQLNRSNAELERFAYVASHDLQEPLRKITTFGERLALNYSEALSERGQWYLDSMRNAASRMQALIDDLLAFSRTTRSDEVFERTDISAIVHGILGDLEISVEQRNATVEIGHLPVIDAVPAQIRQLFQNLISNALKFNDKEQPLITISSEMVYGKDVEEVSRAFFFDRFCRISVKDNGIGFDEKYLSKIFIIFQRLHNRTEYEGTGIGLAICKKIVEYHRGSITARSMPGEGAEFIINLPVRH